VCFLKGLAEGEYGSAHHTPFLESHGVRWKGDDYDYDDDNGDADSTRE
jgi:hypothetical protein